MDCSTPGFPVYHQHPELAQTHVHPVSDAIQPSHPLLSPSLISWSQSLHLLRSRKALNPFMVTSVQFSSIQSLSRVQLFATPWTTARQASLFTTSSWSLPKLMSIELGWSLSAVNFSQDHGLFWWVGSSHQVVKVLKLQLQHQSFQWIFRTDFL